MSANNSNALIYSLASISIVSIGLNLYLYYKLNENDFKNMQIGTLINNYSKDDLKEQTKEIEEIDVKNVVETSIMKTPNEYLPSKTIKMFHSIQECDEYISKVREFNIHSNLDSILSDMLKIIIEVKEIISKECYKESMKNIEILSIEGLHCCGNSQLIKEFAAHKRDYVVYDGQYMCHCQYSNDNKSDYCCVGFNDEHTCHNNNTLKYSEKMLIPLTKRIMDLDMDCEYKYQLLFTIQFLNFYMMNVDIYQHKYRHVIIINYYHALCANAINYMTVNELIPKLEVEDVLHKWPVDMAIPKFVIYVAISTETRMKRMKKKLKLLGKSNEYMLPNRRESISLKDHRTLNRIQKSDSQLQVIYSLISLHNKDLFNTIAVDGSEDVTITANILEELCNQYAIFTNNTELVHPVDTIQSDEVSNLDVENSNKNAFESEIYQNEAEDVFIMDDLIFDNEQKTQKKIDRRRSGEGGGNKRVSLGMYAIF